MYAYGEGNICVCAKCGCSLVSSKDSKDHFIPKSFYGNNLVSSDVQIKESENIVHICKSCNNSIGNSPKSPEWYTYLSDTDKEILYNTITRFINHPNKTAIGIDKVNFYKEVLNFRKVKNVRKHDFSLQDIFKSIISAAGVGSQIKMGSYIINITDNGFELDMVY